MRPSRRAGGLVGPILLIGLGALFLLDNLGLLPANVWEIAWHMWPLILVAWGLELLLGRRSAWGAALALILVLALLVSGVYLLGDTQLESGSPLKIDYPRGEARTADIVLDPAFSYLRVQSGESSSGALLEGGIRPSRGERIEQTLGKDELHPEVVIRTTSLIMLPFVRISSAHPDWDLYLHPALTYNLNVDVGAGKTDLLMEGLMVDDLTVDTGLGQTIVHLPKSGSYRAEISGGIGQLVIHLPDDLGISLTADVGLGALDLPNDFRRVGDAYRSPNYDRAEEKIEVDVSLGIGSIEVR